MRNAQERRDGVAKSYVERRKARIVGCKSGRKSWRMALLTTAKRRPAAMVTVV